MALAVLVVLAALGTVLAPGLGVGDEPGPAVAGAQVPGVGDPGPPEVTTTVAPDVASDGVRRTGPDPSGQPAPSTGQRIVDSAIWLWLVACLAVAAVAVVRVLRRAGDEPPLVDLDERRTERPADPPP